MRRTLAVASIVLALTLTACGTSSNGASDDADTAAPSTTEITPTTPTTSPRSDDGVLVAFPDAAAADVWVDVDDSVMGGISASSSTWLDADGGALVFSGRLSTERNGGFSSTLSPIDRAMGARAAGARALGVHAIGDGRTYVLQLRAGPAGSDRWTARFTPSMQVSGTGPTMTTMPITAFEPVNQFLRPATPSSPLDPSTISQIGVYVLDGQVGEFRLQLHRITAVR